MRILITGGGFLGTHLISKLIALKHEVSILQRSEDHFSNLIAHFAGDIQDTQMVTQVIKTVNPEVVFHLAACKDRQQSLESIRTALEVNLLGTHAVLSACSQLKALKSIVVMGTVEEYGDTPFIPFQESQRERPISAYSLSKTCQTYLCETLARIHDLPVMVLRPSIVYGPAQGLEMFLPALICSLLQGKAYPMTAGEQKRDFIYIDDVVEAMVHAMSTDGIGGEVINIGYGDSVELRILAGHVADLIGQPHLLKLGALPYRKGEIFEYKVNIDKAKELLAWDPVISLEVGLAKTIAYYKGNSA